MPAALLGRVLVVAGVVVLVLSPTAAVVTAGRDAVGQEREPCAVDRADDVVAGGRRLAGDPPGRPAEHVLRAARPGSADLGGQDRATNLTLAAWYSGLPISLASCIGRENSSRVGIVPVVAAAGMASRGAVSGRKGSVS
jgi:hypothetical protein